VVSGVCSGGAGVDRGSPGGAVPAVDVVPETPHHHCAPHYHERSGSKIIPAAAIIGPEDCNDSATRLILSLSPAPSLSHSHLNRSFITEPNS